jgi:transcriptional regulator with GAF, ATPase, and Fis domain
VLRDGDIVELGHTLFLFRDSIPVADEDMDDVDLGARVGQEPLRGMTTLIPQLAHTLTRLERVAAADIPVLIVGESGTGKEVLARAVHGLSGRRGDFVAVNCGAIPENLVESELFGHRKGAFSGASEDRTGLIRAADGGTLFLDEIGDLPAPSQAALLRVLQEREVMPVGGTKPLAVDIRLVAATHRDLEEMVDRGLFRHDLYARIAGFRMEVPPLRERREDLGLLVGALLSRAGDREHPGLDCDAARQLFSYSWPLNIRELENCLSTASVLAGSEPIALEHLPATVRGEARVPAAATDDPVGASTLRLSADDARRRNDLISAMREHKGNISAVARVLGKDRKQIQRWVKRFKLQPDDFK